jgi:hypothetical protein
MLAPLQSAAFVSSMYARLAVLLHCQFDWVISRPRHKAVRHMNDPKLKGAMFRFSLRDIENQA